MQAEAEKLKDILVDGTRTKLVALGIGDAVNVDELTSVASEPRQTNVILVPHFNNLHDVREQLKDASCTGQLTPVTSVPVQ